MHLPKILSWPAFLHPAAFSFYFWLAEKERKEGLEEKTGRKAGGDRKACLCHAGRQEQQPYLTCLTFPHPPALPDPHPHQHLPFTSRLPVLTVW